MMAEIMIAWSTLSASRRFLLVISLKLSPLMELRLLVKENPAIGFMK